MGGSGNNPETLSSLYSCDKSLPASAASRNAYNFNF